MHYLIRAENLKPKPTYQGHSQKFGRAALINRQMGAVHTGLGLCVMEAGGRVDTHIRSGEESFYILEGNPILVMDGRGYRLEPGACGVVPLGVPHAWVSDQAETAKWIDLLVPQPKDDECTDDIYFLGGLGNYQMEELDIRDPRSRYFFRMADDDIVLDKLKLGARVDAPKVSASMSTALLAYSGIAVKMLVDQRLDAQLSNMFMVEYQEGGVAHPHDHPMEEAYVILQGEVEVVADDQRYTLKVGDVFWTGVNCSHAFYNTSKGTVRWLETQSPQPPARYSYRFSRDWEYLKEKLAQAAK